MSDLFVVVLDESTPSSRRRGGHDVEEQHLPRRLSPSKDSFAKDSSLLTAATNKGGVRQRTPRSKQQEKPSSATSKNKSSASTKRTRMASSGQMKTFIVLALLFVALVALATTRRQRRMSSSFLVESSTLTFLCDEAPTLEYVNDEYCDCPDGRDEPRTSACSHLLIQQPIFRCGDAGGDSHMNLTQPSHVSEDKKGSQDRWVYASRVGDGIWDCEDGSDELHSRVRQK